MSDLFGRREFAAPTTARASNPTGGPCWGEGMRGTSQFEPSRSLPGSTSGRPIFAKLYDLIGPRDWPSFGRLVSAGAHPSQ